MGSDGDGAQTVTLGSGSTKYRHVLLWFTAPPSGGQHGADLGAEAARLSALASLPVMSTATMTTSEGPITIELFDEDAPKTVDNFKKLSAGGLLRRAHLPPRDPRLHDPGRLPAGHRHRWPRLPVRGRDQRPQDRPGRAGDGQRGPEHQRLAVLPGDDPGRRVARRQAHRLRPDHLRHGGRRRDRGQADRRARPADRRRDHREGRDHRSGPLRRGPRTARPSRRRAAACKVV